MIIFRFHNGFEFLLLNNIRFEYTDLSLLEYRRLNFYNICIIVCVQKSVKVKVYFCNEPLDAKVSILRNNKISRQALNTIYDLVWESEFKNILNVGRIWLKFKNEKRPFGIPLREKRSHDKIDVADIIQISNDFYIVDQIGCRKIEIVD